MESELREGLDEFQEAMEAEYGYRPQAFATGVLISSRDDDRFDGWRLAMQVLSNKQAGVTEAAVEIVRDRILNAAIGEGWQHKVSFPLLKFWDNEIRSALEAAIGAEGQPDPQEGR